jgi:3-keto-L-gulonate-6-phosphate decarboxylase
MDLPAPTTTRKQLRGYGASHYLARRLTTSLTPITKSGSAYVYTIEQVITAIREYKSKAQIQLTTKRVLEQIMAQLLTQLNNVIPLAMAKGSKTEVSNVARQLLHQMHRTDKALAELKATAASMGKHTS